DRAPGNRDPLLTQYLSLEPGTYYLAVSASAAVSGAAAVGPYVLATDFVPSPPPFQADGVEYEFSVGKLSAVLTGDFNGDGITDLALGRFDEVSTALIVV